MSDNILDPYSNKHSPETRSARGDAKNKRNEEEVKCTALAAVPYDGDSSNEKGLFSPNPELDGFPSPDYGNIGKLFSLRKPRDLGAGLSSGIKNVAKGVGFGVASLFFAPGIAASGDGVAGFFCGLGFGLFFAVAMPIAGVGIGISQVARGALNTPEAIKSKHAGRKWDKNTREWKINWYSLDEEAEEVAKQAVIIKEEKKNINKKEASSGSGTAEEGREVLETGYYDTLQVAPNATQAEIRKSYYKLARECHPDKNSGDPENNRKFQSLGEAYQVLGDVERRQQYDTHGAQGCQDMSIMDSSVFFAILFGSDQLEPFVGKLQIRTFVESIDNPNIPSDHAERIMKFEQLKREVELAVLLRSRLDGYMDCSVAEQRAWARKMAATAQKLCALSFGVTFVEAIGWSYENFGLQFQGKHESVMGMQKTMAKMRAQRRELGKIFRAARSAVRASYSARKLAAAAKRKEKAAAANQTEGEDGTKTYSEEEQHAAAEGAKQYEETIPVILETMLNIGIFDLESTVRQASKKVLKNMAEPLDRRLERARALIKLGQIFQEEAEKYKKAHEDEPVDIMRQLHEAVVRAAEEADSKFAKESETS